MPIRPIRPDHLPRLLPLVKPGFEELELDADYLNANVFEDPDFDQELCMGAFEDDELVAMAMAVPRRVTDGSTAETVGHLKILQARDGPRPAELLETLLERAEVSLRRHGAMRVQTGGAAPVYLLPGLPRRRRSTRGTLERAGYRIVKPRRSMTVELTRADLDTGDTERRLRGDGIVFRRGEEYDRSEVPGRVRSVFSDNFAHEVERALDDASRGSVHLALHGAGESCRLAGFSVARLWAANAFGPLGTVPEFEGRGVGAVLLKRALSDLHADGIVTGVIPWVGPEEFYQRAVNAETTLDYDVLEKRLEHSGA